MCLFDLIAFGIMILESETWPAGIKNAFGIDIKMS